jgi:hypothetical protein
LNGCPQDFATHAFLSRSFFQRIKAEPRGGLYGVIWQGERDNLHSEKQKLPDREAEWTNWTKD